MKATQQTSSTSSTEEYGQEAFQLYAKRVTEVAKSIFPKLEDEPVVYHIAGGSYNRITGVTVKDQGILREYVFRTPRFLGPVDRSAAILHHLQQHTSIIPAPAIIAEKLLPLGPTEADSEGCIDLATAGLVDRQEAYLLLEKLPGTSLFQEYDNFSHIQKVDFAKQFATLMADIFDIPVPQAIGRLAAGDEGVMTVQSFFNRRGTLPVTGKPPDVPNPLDIADYLENLFSYMHAIELERNPAGLYGPRVYKKLMTSVKNLLSSRSAELSDLCYTVFYHGDLAGRNVLVTPLSTLDGERWKISGVLDWEDCSALPPICAYWSPNWLWSEHNETEADALPVGWEFDEDPSAEPSNDEQREIKAAFVEAIEIRIPNYMRVVGLGREMKIKQMLFIAQNGISHPVTHDVLDDIFVRAGIPRLWDTEAPSLIGSSDSDSMEPSSECSSISSGSDSAIGDGDSDSTPSEGGFEEVPNAGPTCDRSSEASSRDIPLPPSTDSPVATSEIATERNFRAEADLASRTEEHEKLCIKQENEGTASQARGCIPPVADKSDSNRAETESLELSNCFSTFRQWLARRRAVRREKLAKRRQKMLGVVRYLGQAIMHLTS